MISMMPVLPQSSSMTTSAVNGSEKSGGDFAETLRSESAALHRTAGQDAHRTAGGETSVQHEEGKTPVRVAGRAKRDTDSAAKKVGSEPAKPADAGKDEGASVAVDAAGKEGRSSETGKENLNQAAKTEQGSVLPDWLIVPQVMTVSVAGPDGKASETSTADSGQSVLTAAGQLHVAQIGLGRTGGPVGKDVNPAAGRLQVVPTTATEPVAPVARLNAGNAVGTAVPQESEAAGVPTAQDTARVEIPAPSVGLTEQSLQGVVMPGPQLDDRAVRPVVANIAQTDAPVDAKLTPAANVSANSGNVIGVRAVPHDLPTDITWMDPTDEAPFRQLNAGGLEATGQNTPAAPATMAGADVAGSVSPGPPASDVAPGPKGTEPLVDDRAAVGTTKPLAPRGPNVATGVPVGPQVTAAMPSAPSAPEVTARSVGSDPVLMVQTATPGVNVSTPRVERSEPGRTDNSSAVASGQPISQAAVVVKAVAGGSGTDERQFASFTHTSDSKVAVTARPAESLHPDFSTLLHGRDDATLGGVVRTAASSQTVGTASAPLPLSESRIVEQVVSRVSMSSAGGETNLSMLLHPKELGEVRVDLISGKDGLRAHLHSQTQMVQEVLERNLPRLREAFESQGLKVTDLQVSLDDRRGNSNNPAFQQGRQERMPQSGYRVADTAVKTAEVEWPGALGATGSGWSATAGFSLRV